MTGLFESVAYQVAAYRIVDCLVGGTLVALFAGLLLRVTPRQNSGTRFAVWFSALMAIAALPFVSGVGLGEWSHVGHAAAASRAITLPSSLALYLFVAWAVVAAWALLRIVVSFRQLQLLRKSFVPVDPSSLDVRLQQTLENNLGARKAALYTSDCVNVPTAVGLLKPAIVLPGWVMNELSPAELNDILLHELAHLRRWDDWTNLAQQVVKALFFFHPAVWWLERQVSLEREMACDDAVIAQTASPRAYAQCLAHLAEKTLIRRSVALAQAALGRIRQTSLRVAQILDVNRPAGSGPLSRAAVPLVAVFAVACAVGISRTPRLITFQDSAPEMANMQHASPQILAPSILPAMAASPVRAFSRASDVMPKLVPAKFVSVAPKSLTVKSAGMRSAGMRSAKAPARKFASSTRQPVGFIEASATTQPTDTARPISPTSEQGSELASASESPTLDPLLANLLRLTSLDETSPVPLQAVFVLIESRQSDSADQPAYEIRVWRLTVWHPAPVSKIPPRKET